MATSRGLSVVVHKLNILKIEQSEVIQIFTLVLFTVFFSFCFFSWEGGGGGSFPCFLSGSFPGFIFLWSFPFALSLAFLFNNLFYFHLAFCFLCKLSEGPFRETQSLLCSLWITRLILHLEIKGPRSFGNPFSFVNFVTILLIYSLCFGVFFPPFSLLFLLIISVTLRGLFQRGPKPTL